MLGLDFLDLLIGLFLVYFVFAVMTSGLTEVIAGALSLRAENLARGIKIMLQNDQKALDAFYNHAAVQALAPPGKKPSYIPADVVARVYAAISDVEEAVEDKVSPATRARVSQALEAYVGPEVDRLKSFFNNTMDRAVGWYKRKTQYIVLVLALIVVTVSNADTIMMVNTLWQDPTSRAQLVAIAERQPVPGEDAPAEQALREAVQTRDSVAGLGILGWEGRKDGIDNPRAVPDWPKDVDSLLPWVSKVIGLGITVGAVAMGAPFWYNLMGQLLKARASLTGKRPEDNPAQT